MRVNGRSEVKVANCQRKHVPSIGCHLDVVRTKLRNLQQTNRFGFERRGPLNSK